MHSDLNQTHIFSDYDVSKSTTRLLFLTQYGQEIPLNFANEIYNRITGLIESAKNLAMNKTSDFDIRLGDYLYSNLTCLTEHELSQALKEERSVKLNFCVNL